MSFRYVNTYQWLCILNHKHMVAMLLYFSKNTHNNLDAACAFQEFRVYLFGIDSITNCTGQTQMSKFANCFLLLGMF